MHPSILRLVQLITAKLNLPEDGVGSIGVDPVEPILYVVNETGHHAPLIVANSFDELQDRLYYTAFPVDIKQASDEAILLSKPSA